MGENELTTQFAILKNNYEHHVKALEQISLQLTQLQNIVQEMNTHLFHTYATKVEVSSQLTDMRKSLTNELKNEIEKTNIKLLELKNIKKIIYGAIGLTLTTVFLAILSTVLK